MRTKLFIAFVFISISLQAQCWSKISSGLYHNLAIASNGTLWSWGYNNSGQLGDGTTNNRTAPVQVGTSSNWVSVHAGYYHSFAIKSDGTLWAWGLNSTYQLGDGTVANKLIPTQIGTSTNWVKVTGGENFSAGIKSDGTLWMWGSDTQEQMGNGSGVGNNIPTQLGSATDWADVKAGRYHVVALKNYNRVYTWGYNGNGQIGNGASGTNVNVPYLIPGTLNFTKIEAGVNSTFAIRDDNTLYMCGLNTTSSTTMQQIMYPMTWDSVKAGIHHVIALKSDGTLWGWGNNTYGQIAQPGFNMVNTPYQIAGSSYSNNFGANIYSTVVLKTDGSLYGCGQNNVSQLGDNTSIDKVTMTSVSCPSVLDSEYFSRNLDYQLYPNPTKDLVSISLVSKLKLVQVFSVHGQKIFETNSNSFSISHLLNGLYLIKIQDESGAEAVQKLIKS